MCMLSWNMHVCTNADSCTQVYNAGMHGHIYIYVCVKSSLFVSLVFIMLIAYVFLVGCCFLARSGMLTHVSVDVVNFANMYRSSYLESANCQSCLVWCSRTFFVLFSPSLLFLVLHMLIAYVYIVMCLCVLKNCVYVGVISIRATSGCAVIAC